MVRRPRALGALVLVLALVVSACGPGGTTAEVGSTAASVNGRVIERAPLEADVRAVLEAEPEAFPDPAQVQRQLLTLEILHAVVASIVEERGLTISDDVRTEFRTAFLEQLGPDEATATAALVARGVTLEFFDRVVVPYAAARNVIAADLAGDRSLELREARHILVETLEEAEAVLAELEAGADFAELAAERSTDTGSAVEGGSLGPAPRGRFVPEFDAFVWTAALEEVSEPVQTQYGFHVIQVIGIEEQLASEMSISELLAFVGPEVDELIDRALRSAAVSVAPGLGVWDPVALEVVAEPVVGETP